MFICNFLLDFDSKFLSSVLQFGAAAIVLMLSRAEDIFITAKDTINMTERREWNVMLGGLCEAAVVAVEAKEQPTAPMSSTGGQLEKVVAHLLRFPDLVKSQSLLKALSAQQQVAVDL